jgi:hypothetical protein
VIGPSGIFCSRDNSQGNTLQLCCQYPAHQNGYINASLKFGCGEERGNVDLESSLLFFWEAVVDVKMAYKCRPLMQLVDKFRGHLCFNPRNNIYALLGLSTLQPGSLVVDYPCTIKQLFEEVWTIVKNDLAGDDINCLKRVLHFGPYYKRSMQSS